MFLHYWDLAVSIWSGVDLHTRSRDDLLVKQIMVVLSLICLSLKQPRWWAMSISSLIFVWFSSTTAQQLWLWCFLVCLWGSCEASSSIYADTVLPRWFSFQPLTASGHYFTHVKFTAFTSAFRVSTSVNTKSIDFFQCVDAHRVIVDRTFQIISVLCNSVTVKSPFSLFPSGFAGVSGLDSVAVGIALGSVCLWWRSQYNHGWVQSQRQQQQQLLSKPGHWWF